MNLIAYTPLLIRGAAISVASWLIAGSASMIIGTTLGIISCRRLGLSRLSRAIQLYTFIARGVPAYVHILIAYFGIPQLLGINIPGFIAATGALAFCSSGYMTEIVRAGINAIPQGQWDACAVLGCPLPATLRYVIGPQALRTILPAALGELEQLLKSSSLLATIGITELTRTGMNIISRELNPLPVYLVVACMYLLLSAGLFLIARYAERRTCYGGY